MIIYLLYHDIISCGRSLLIYLALNLAMSSFFAMVDDPTWWMYIIIGSGQIAGIATMYIIRSKQLKAEILLSSLPLKRSMQVYGRYVMAALVIVFSCFVWLLNAHLLHHYFSGAPADLFLFQQPLLLFILAIFFTLFISLLLPVTFRFSHFWVHIVVAVVGLSVFILIFGNARQLLLALQEQFAASGIAVLLLISFLSIGIFFASIKYSIQNYITRDL
ncbi:ABC-2 transporter permease [candidate division KSB1 bacterium]|nr:ABC-2 transporter permease [candidate division KSB1 bacterium]